MQKRTILFILFTSAYVLSQFYRSTNAVIAPDLAKELSLNAAELGLMTSLFFAAFAAAQIPVGVGLDRWGPRWVTSSLMSIGVVGSLVFAVAHSFGMLSLGRVLLGLGMAGILMGAVKAFSQWYPANRFATMTGLLTGIGLLGALLSATPLVWLNSEIGWRAVFVIGAVLTGVVALGIALWTRNTPPGVKWEDKRQSRSDLPAILTSNRFWRIALFTGFIGGMVGAFRGLWAGPYLFDVLHSGKIETGNFLLLMGIGSIAGSVTAGWLTDRLGIARVGVSLAILCLLCQVVLAIAPPRSLVGLVYVLLGIFQRSPRGDDSPCPAALPGDDDWAGRIVGESLCLRRNISSTMGNGHDHRHFPHRRDWALPASGLYNGFASYGPGDILDSYLVLAAHAGEDEFHALNLTFRDGCRCRCNANLDPVQWLHGQFVRAA